MDAMPAVIKLIGLVVATEALVELVKDAAPLQGIKNWIVANTPWLHSSYNDTHLLECGYCLSVWAAIVLVVVTQWEWAWWVVVGLVAHRAANYIHLCYSLLRDMQLDIRANRNKSR